MIMNIFVFDFDWYFMKYLFMHNFYSLLEKMHTQTFGVFHHGKKMCQNYACINIHIYFF